MNECALPAGFEKVWERVTAVSESTDVPLTKKEELEMFISRERSSIDFYGMMLKSGLFRDKRQTLGRILSDERRHIRDLQMEYFMLTGDTAPEGQGVYTENSRDGLKWLREAYLAETESSKLYAEAAGSRAGDLRDIYTVNASDESIHAGLIKEMICKCFDREP